MNHHGRAVPRVVGGHHRARTALLKAHAERHGIVFAKEALVEIGRSMGSAVLVLIGEEVLHQRSCLPMFRIGPLQSVHERHRQRADQVRVFAHRLFRAAPAWIAAQIGIGRAHHDSATIKSGFW